MEFELEQAVNWLARTPVVLRAMLQGLPTDWVSRNEGEKTWSPYDVIGHLIQGEQADWIPRARLILEQGEAVTFPPFDRFAQFEASQGRTLEELLNTFAELRRQNIETLQALKLQPEDLLRCGMHPAFGSVTLKELLATWVAHDLDHIVQSARTLAKQYRHEVGPWQAYLSVMK